MFYAFSAFAVFLMTLATVNFHQNTRKNESKHEKVPVSQDIVLKRGLNLPGYNHEEEHHEGVLPR